VEFADEQRLRSSDSAGLLRYLARAGANNPSAWHPDSPLRLTCGSTANVTRWYSAWLRPSRS